MDVASHYSELLSIFIALIIGGTAIKLAITERSEKTYEFRGQFYSRDKVHTFMILVTLGAVIQIVSNSMKTLDGRSLLLDEKILVAYGISLAVMVLKK